MRAAAAVLGIIGAAFLAVGIYLGTATVNRDGIACGSALRGAGAAHAAAARAGQRAYVQRVTATLEGQPASRARRPAYVADCQSAIDGRRTTALLAGAPGAAALLAALVVAGMHNGASTREVEAPSGRLT